MVVVVFLDQSSPWVLDYLQLVRRALSESSFLDNIVKLLSEDWFLGVHKLFQLIKKPMDFSETPQIQLPEARQCEEITTEYTLITKLQNDRLSIDLKWYNLSQEYIDYYKLTLTDVMLSDALMMIFGSTICLFEDCFQKKKNYIVSEDGVIQIKYRIQLDTHTLPQKYEPIKLIKQRPLDLKTMYHELFQKQKFFYEQKILTEQEQDLQRQPSRQEEMLEGGHQKDQSQSILSEKNVKRQQQKNGGQFEEEKMRIRQIQGTERGRGRGGRRGRGRGRRDNEDQKGQFKDSELKNLDSSNPKPIIPLHNQFRKLFEVKENRVKYIGEDSAWTMIAFDINMLDHYSFSIEKMSLGRGQFCAGVISERFIGIRCPKRNPNNETFSEVVQCAFYYDGGSLYRNQRPKKFGVVSLKNIESGKVMIEIENDQNRLYYGVVQDNRKPVIYQTSLEQVSYEKLYPFLMMNGNEDDLEVNIVPR